MLEVSEELKELYKKRSVNKELLLLFKEWNKAIGNENLKMESMGIVESICSDTELTFGGCEAAEFSITVADITEDLNGQTFTVTQVLDNNPSYVMPLGTYTVKSCKRQSDRRFKDIVAYDDMIKLDRDVVAWYNSRTFPVTLKSLRESLLVYCGIAYETQDLPNDGVLINKTVRPSAMNGRDVMKRICELNGGFGHITRENKFKVITLAGLGLYPSETLYPSEDLFPAESGEIIDGSSSGAIYYPESTYEDYICRAIDQLKIRTNEEDGGITVNNGTAGKNEYIIQGNFLISDKTKGELTDIAEALFLVIKNKYYRPHNMIVTGLPYLEVGDSILINTRDDVIESFIFTRTLSGIQALKDSLGATGYEFRQNKIGLDIQISQLEQEASQLKETTEEMEVDLEKLTGRVGEVEVIAERTEYGLIFKVSVGEVSNQLSIEKDQVYIGGNRLVVDSTNFKLDADGNSEFSGTVNGAVVIAKKTLHLCDQYHQNNKEAMGANDNVLYIGAGFPDGAVFFYDLIVSGDMEVVKSMKCKNANVTSKMTAGTVEATSVNCQAINANSHTHNYRTSDIYWEDNGNGNMVFASSGGRYGASTAWVLENFERASCDERMKEDIAGIDKAVFDAYMQFVPVKYKYKEKAQPSYNSKINFGVTAQNIMQAFEENGIDWKEYDIIEEKSAYDIDLCGDIAEYTNGEDYYVVNDKNLHALHIAMIQRQQATIQNQQKKIISVEQELSSLKKLLMEKGVI